MATYHTLEIVASIGFSLAFVLSVIGTRVVLAVLRKRQVMDVPNERSSHVTPTPRGGGWGVVGAAALAGLLLVPVTDPGPWLALLAAAMLIVLVLSWFDDLGGLGVTTRLLGQFCAVACAVAGVVLAGGPLLDIGRSAITSLGPLAVPAYALAALTLGLGYVWFVNLYNFMDGIDGISAVETVSVNAGIAIVALVHGPATDLLVTYPLILGGAACGFLVWNWHPAQVFLGDVGSVPLGIAVGFFLLVLAVSGNLAAAMILPLYYIGDATLTLGWRFVKGEKVWQAHRSHWYQRAAMAIGHRQTVLAILGCNLGLIALALMAHVSPVPAFAAGVLWTLLFLAGLSLAARRGKPVSAA